MELDLIVVVIKSESRSRNHRRRQVCIKKDHARIWSPRCHSTRISGLSEQIHEANLDLPLAFAVARALRHMLELALALARALAAPTTLALALALTLARALLPTT